MAQNTLHEVAVTRVLNVPVVVAWSYWTEAEKIQRWWGPDHFVCPTARVDFREGGTSVVSMASPDYGFPEQHSTWLYTKIVPMERIEYIHNLCDPQGRRVDPTAVGLPADFPQDLKTVVTFVALGDKTELTVREFLPATSMLENARLGLNQSIDKMVEDASS